MTTTGESLLNQIVDKPDDWHTRFVLADWYDDHGNPCAKGMRFSAEKQKRPYKNTQGMFVFFNEAMMKEDMGDPESNLPSDVYEKVKADKTVANHKIFKSAKEAEEALMEAMK